MSNRTLIEINHDYSHRIGDAPSKFATDLAYFLATGSDKDAEDLEQYGIRVIGMKHHSDGHTIKWGGVEEKVDD